MNLKQRNKDLSLALKSARARKNLSLLQVAKNLSVEIERIKAIESEPFKTPVCELYKIIRLYDLPREDIFPLLFNQR